MQVSFADDENVLSSYVDDLTFCSHLLSSTYARIPAFRTEFSFCSCVPVFPSVRELNTDDHSSALLSALRGKGMPLSYKIDYEAAEWACAFLLDQHTNDSCEALFEYLDRIGSDMESGQDTRVCILYEMTDPCSLGTALAFLRYLRSVSGKGSLNVSLTALVRAESPRKDSFFPSVRKSLLDLQQRHPLRRSADDPSPGADSLCVLSLPSSMAENSDSHQLIFLAAARFLAECFSDDKSFPYGLHVRTVPGCLSLRALGDEAVSFAAFMEYSAWLLSDLLPGLHNWMTRSGRLRSFQPNSRNAFFRSLFADTDLKRLEPSLPVLEHTLIRVLDHILGFLQSIPVQLRLSDDTVSLWKKAVDACGRFITVASEYDVTSAEVNESGLVDIRPVHRDSMADTEEERLQRRLLLMKEQLEEEKRLRDDTLTAVGPFRTVQAIQDCRRMCGNALMSARSRISGMSPDTQDHLTIARQDRRIRLLEAAVVRCDSELSQSVVGNSPSSSVTEGVTRPSDGILNPEAFSVLQRIVRKYPDEPAEKELRDQIPVLLEGYSLPETRDLLRSLVASSRNASVSDPLLHLLIYAWNTCLKGVSAVDDRPHSGLPAVPLLPDLIPSGPLSALPDLIRLIPGNSTSDDHDTAELRGLLAMLMLRPYKRRESGEAALKVISCDPDSPFVRSWLSEHHASRVFLVCLSSESQPDVPFAAVIPGQLLIPARRMESHASLIPSFVLWYDNLSASYMDPCDYLSEGDRSLLFHRLSDILASWPDNSDSPLKRFLSAFRLDLGKESSSEPDPSFSVRVKSVCGLLPLPAYDGVLSRLTRYYEHFLDNDPVASCLTGMDRFPAVSCTGLPDEVVYTWRGIPFARENTKTILESMGVPEEKHALSGLNTECEILSGISDDFRDETVRGASALLDRFHDAIPDYLSVVRAVLSQAKKPVTDQTPELSWPWDPLSPSIRTVLRECLGETVSTGFLTPFSDSLAVFPARSGEVIGDSMFSSMCSIMPWSADSDSGVSADAVLPPLSPSLIRAVCFHAEGRVLIDSDFIRLERPDDHSIRVILTLNGAFTLRLVRLYSAEEIVPLYAHDIPTLSLWPSMPFRAEDWHAYFVYAHLPESFSVSVLTDETSSPVLLNEPQFRRVAMMNTFPVAFIFSRGDTSIGALPNLLPEPHIDPSSEVTACIDFGSVGTSVVFAASSGRKPLQGPTVVRSILNNPAASSELLRREFLPAVPVSALLPTASRIFRNVPGVSPIPFVDGIILMSSDLQDVLSIPSDALYTCLKWEEEKGRSGLLCLHQVMLMAALQARTDGASSLSWRFALPDEMASEGRESLRSLFCRLIEKVNQESGFSCDASGLPVSFASESTALGAYFRLCAWEDTRGGFMVLDIGACTADISLFLRGREQAVRTCQIPLGVHYMLLPSLLRDPGMLKRDFSGYPDEAFNADLESLTKILSAARTDPPSLRKTRMALDHFLADHYTLLLDAIVRLSSSGVPSRFAAVLMLHLSYLMMLSGLVLLQIAADPNKNDFLPEQMSLCLSGRGSLLIEKLPEPVKKALWGFLTMFRNKRVASLSLLFSAEKKMEIAVGLSVLQNTCTQLPPASSVPASLSVRPEELLPEFLLRFAREFPEFALMLFPDFFTGDYYHPFTPGGESAISAALDQSFTIRETPRPYDSLASWIGNLLELC